MELFLFHERKVSNRKVVNPAKQNLGLVKERKERKGREGEERGGKEGRKENDCLNGCCKLSNKTILFKF